MASRTGHGGRSRAEVVHDDRRTRSPRSSASTRPSGLAAETAAERLESDGPNALPAEKTEPGWRQFLDQYAAYMQIILLVAGTAVDCDR